MVLRLHNMEPAERQAHDCFLWLQKAGGPAAISMVELAGGNSGFQEMDNVRADPRLLPETQQSPACRCRKLWNVKLSAKHVKFGAQPMGNDIDAVHVTRQVWGASWEMPVSPQPPLSVRVTDSEGNKVRMRCRHRHHRLQHTPAIGPPNNSVVLLLHNS